MKRLAPLLLLLAVAEPRYNLIPHSLKFGLVTVTDSIHYTWTMPESASGGGVALHSWMTPELWFLPQFQPGFPPRWDLRRVIWSGPAAAPNKVVQVTTPVFGYGSVWIEVVGPGGRSPRSNNADSKLQ